MLRREKTIPKVHFQVEEKNHESSDIGPGKTRENIEGVFLSLIDPLQKAVAIAGYTVPTPIQEQAIPELIKGRDMVGCAQTGTGKTAAFTLPILQYLTNKAKKSIPCQPYVLILAPTRELTAQIHESITTYSRYLPITKAVIFGGVGQNPQVNSMRRGVHIVTATPGRLLDLINQGHIHLDKIEVFVLDEADRMLDMGFIHDIRKIIKMLPAKRQTLFFSATMEPVVMQLADSLVHDPVHITIAPDQPVIEKINQKVLFVEKKQKDQLLQLLLEDYSLNKVLVFTQMKHIANRVADKLESAGIKTAAIHGNKSQSARTQALANFKAGRVRVLVATDIAARGIDIDSISHVINYDLPNESSTYVHRIGRTARAGADGSAISFCSSEERVLLRSIERLLRKPIPADLEHALHSESAYSGYSPLPKQVPATWSRSSSSSSRSGKSNYKQYGQKKRIGNW